MFLISFWAPTKRNFLFIFLSTFYVYHICILQGNKLIFYTLHFLLIPNLSCTSKDTSTLLGICFIATMCFWYQNQFPKATWKLTTAEWPNITENFSLIVLKARSTKSRCQQGYTSSRDSKRNSILYFFQVTTDVLWLVATSLQSVFPWSLCRLLHVSSLLYTYFITLCSHPL